MQGLLSVYRRLPPGFDRRGGEVEFTRNKAGKIQARRQVLGLRALRAYLPGLLY
jgi:hypothetical protein